MTVIDEDTRGEKRTNNVTPECKAPYSKIATSAFIY